MRRCSAVADKGGGDKLWCACVAVIGAHSLPEPREADGGIEDFEQTWAASPISVDLGQIWPKWTAARPISTELGEVRQPQGPDPHFDRPICPRRNLPDVYQTWALATTKIGAAFETTMAGCLEAGLQTNTGFAVRKLRRSCPREITTFYITIIMDTIPMSETSVFVSFPESREHGIKCISVSRGCAGPGAPQRYPSRRAMPARWSGTTPIPSAGAADGPDGGYLWLGLGSSNSVIDIGRCSLMHPTAGGGAQMRARARPRRRCRRPPANLAAKSVRVAPAVPPPALKPNESL